MNTKEICGLLADAACRLGVRLDDRQIDLFVIYMDMLLEWRERFNLTAISDPRDVVLKHFADSLSLVPLVGKGALDVIDVGSGAGFPGIPLKIALPEIGVTLLDAVNKRVGFLNAAIERLGLEGINAIHSRAEDAGHSEAHREVYDLAVSRAVAALPVLAEYALPFVKPGGRFAAMKGPAVQEELQSAQAAIRVLGGDRISTISVEIPFTDITHSIVCVSKYSHTPPRFPRKASQIAKRSIM